MLIPASRIDEAVQAGPKSYIHRRESSLVAHEIIHNPTDDEDLPLFLELIYMLEQNGGKRIKEIGALLTNGQLSHPYVAGLENITKWLNYKTPEKMLETLPTQDIENLKEKFRKRMKEYCKSELS